MGMMQRIAQKVGRGGADDQARRKAGRSRAQVEGGRGETLKTKDAIVNLCATHPVLNTTLAEQHTAALRMIHDGGEHKDDPAIKAVSNAQDEAVWLGYEMGIAEMRLMFAVNGSTLTNLAQSLAAIGMAADLWRADPKIEALRGEAENALALLVSYTQAVYAPLGIAVK